jgi:hypothetical protein
MLVAAAPALAQAPAPVSPPAVRIPPEITDPRTADRLANAMEALSRAFLELPVGDVQAALEGRPATSSDHRRTVRSETGMSEREMHARIAASRPMIEQSMKAVQQSLPAMMQGLQQAQQALERAVANMPDPTYPRR